MYRFILQCQIVAHACKFRPATKFIHYGFTLAVCPIYIFVGFCLDHGLTAMQTAMDSFLLRLHKEEEEADLGSGPEAAAAANNDRSATGHRDLALYEHYIGH